MEDIIKDHKFFGIIQTKFSKILPSIRKLILNLLNLLNNKKIDIDAVRNYIYNTEILEMENSLRSLCWKLLLGYLTEDNEQWENQIEEKRKEYSKLKDEYIGEVIKKAQNKKADHPLSMKNDSNWASLIKNNQLNELIDKDIKRTRNEVPFFTDKSKLNPQESNSDVIKRILFIFAHKYPQIKYVQGLNEIAATIYYCFCSDENPYFYLSAEEDTFFCFENLINKISDIYIQEKDYTVTGIQTRLEFIKRILKTIDEELFESLGKNSIDLTVVTFRWFS
ncbi:MAG: hypothetical protein MJ252_01920, partial [archaeon]|nr:hypothetical protein [archaeon]